MRVGLPPTRIIYENRFTVKEMFWKLGVLLIAFGVGKLVYAWVVSKRK